MRLQVKGKNVEVTPSIREYAEAKLAKLDKQLAADTQVEVELSEEKNPSIPAHHVAEATIFTKGPTLRAHESARDIRASIDQLVDNLERQVKRYREKRRHEPSAAPLITGFESLSQARAAARAARARRRDGARRSGAAVPRLGRRRHPRPAPGPRVGRRDDGRRPRGRR